MLNFYKHIPLEREERTSSRSWRWRVEGRREVMAAMKVICEVEKVKKMKIELREFVRRERK